jgi:hypothetical protein
MDKMWQQAIHVHGWMIGVSYISTKMEDHSLFWLLNYVVTKIWWSTNWWNQNLTLGEHMVTKICNPIMPWSKLDSQLVWPNFSILAIDNQNWSSNCVAAKILSQHQKQKWGAVIKEKSFKSDKALPFKNRTSRKTKCINWRSVSYLTSQNLNTRTLFIYFVSSQQSKILTKSMSCHPSELANLNSCKWWRGYHPSTFHSRKWSVPSCTEELKHCSQDPWLPSPSSTSSCCNSSWDDWRDQANHPQEIGYAGACFKLSKFLL